MRFEQKSERSPKAPLRELKDRKDDNTFFRLSERSTVVRTVFNFMAKPKNIYRLLICFVLLSAMLALPLLSRARTTAGSITITNNSGREIRHLYLSPVGSDNWNSDQLGRSVMYT